MNPECLTTLLAAGAADAPQRSPACPDEHQIAGYVEGRLEPPDCEQLERHAADCGHCLALIGALSREREAGTLEPVWDGVVAPVRMPAQERPRRRWRIAPQWAAAAALVLAVPLLLQLGRDLERGGEGQGSPAPSSTRSIEATATGLQVLSPEAGRAVDTRRLSFRWTEVRGTPYYDVRIVTDAGDVVIRQRVTGTNWWLPAQLKLQPGAEYFVHVDAYPSGDKAVSSDHVPFRVLD